MKDVIYTMFLCGRNFLSVFTKGWLLKQRVGKLSTRMHANGYINIKIDYRIVDNSITTHLPYKGICHEALTPQSRWKRL